MSVIYQTVLTGQPVNPKIWSFVFFLVLYGFILIFAMYSTIYANIKLGKPGISKEVRSLVLKRHVTAIIIYTVCNLYIPATAFEVLLYGSTHSVKEFNKPWKIFLKLLYFS